jgi:NADPH:quinone reductase-like Zn-dependent oxidoreductase
VLRPRDVDVPEPGPGQVRIAVRAAGVNGLDSKIRAGLMKDAFPVEFPFVPGLEASGVVDAVGSKFAVEGLSEALHYELTAIGVRVKIVEPGIVNTDFGGRSFDFNNDESLTQYQEVVGAFFSAPA